MLRLALLRHAKSSWDEPSLDDFERPLSTRGRAAAPLMGHVLASLKFEPDVILCSPSQRTRETLAGIAPTFSGTPDVAFDGLLYLASAGDLLVRIKLVANPKAQILVIGHNPGLHTLAARLAVLGDPALIARLNDRFPTAALAVFSFPQPAWPQLDPATGHLDAFITPKDRA
jgi:phosphohistidine phosphatase